MKKIQILRIVCFFLLSFNYACEKADFQKPPLQEVYAVTLRTEDCTDCPIDDCCCGIQWLSGNQSLTIQFCGTSGSRLSNETCEATPPSPCSQISGYLFGPVNLNSITPKQAFCMNPGDSFVIYVGGNGFASFRITCQDDMSNPQSITVTLTGGNRYYFDTNGGCDVVECN